VCGVFGVFNLPHRDSVDPICTIVEKYINKRGPDNFGFSFDQNLGSLLCHSRLAINDLTDTGLQPMRSYDGRYEISFNGEIYNFRKIAQEFGFGDLRSDTRVFVELVASIGLRESLRRIEGAFAAIIVDRRKEEIFFCRDPFGQKPLSYGSVHINGSLKLVAASTVDVISALSDVPLVRSREAIHWYFSTGNVPAPLTVFESVAKVMPGELIVFDYKELRTNSKSGSFHTLGRAERYFDQTSLAPIGSVVDGRASDLSSVLQSAVIEMLDADECVGTFLSGGIDSAVINLLASRVMPAKNLHAFTLGFSDSSFDESKDASEYAAALGITHHTLKFSEDDLAQKISEILSAYDEPFADSSQIPTFLLSEYASKHIKVIMSGDGGDELFGGYNRHIYGPAWVTRANIIPSFLRCPIARFISELDDRTLSAIGMLTRQRRPIEKLRRLATIFSADLDNPWSRYLVFLLTNSSSVSVDFQKSRRIFERYPCPQIDSMPSAQDFMSKDLAYYLPNDVLAKVDRASMANGLEVRAPFLDTRVARLAATIALEDKISGGHGKQPLRKILNSGPKCNALKSKKNGFAFPLGSSLRKELHSWALDMIQFAAKDDVITENVTKIWKDHMAGEDQSAVLWPIICYGYWSANEPSAQQSYKFIRC